MIDTGRTSDGGSCPAAEGFSFSAKSQVSAQEGADSGLEFHSGFMPPAPIEKGNSWGYFFQLNQYLIAVFSRFCTAAFAPPFEVKFSAAEWHADAKPVNEKRSHAERRRHGLVIKRYCRAMCRRAETKPHCTVPGPACGKLNLARPGLVGVIRCPILRSSKRSELCSGYRLEG